MLEPPSCQEQPPKCKYAKAWCILLPMSALCVYLCFNVEFWRIQSGYGLPLNPRGSWRSGLPEQMIRDFHTRRIKERRVGAMATEEEIRAAMAEPLTSQELALLEPQVIAEVARSRAHDGIARAVGLGMFVYLLAPAILLLSIHLPPSQLVSHRVTIWIIRIVASICLTLAFYRDYGMSFMNTID